MISRLIASFFGGGLIGHGLMPLFSIAKWRDLLNSQLPVYDSDRQAPPDLLNLLPEGTDVDPDGWLTHHKSIPAFPHRNASALSNRCFFASKRGMVQANVGKKLVKRNKITSFHQCPKVSSGHCSNKYKCNMTTTPPYVILITNPPTNYILTLVKLFSFIWYVIPLLKAGALALTCNLFVQVNDEKTQKNRRRYVRLMFIGASACPMVASSGF